MSPAAWSAIRAAFGRGAHGIRARAEGLPCHRHGRSASHRCRANARLPGTGCRSPRGARGTNRRRHRRVHRRHDYRGTCILQNSGGPLSKAGRGRGHGARPVAFRIDPIAPDRRFHERWPRTVPVVERTKAMKKRHWSSVSPARPPSRSQSERSKRRPTGHVTPATHSCVRPITRVGLPRLGLGMTYQPPSGSQPPPQFFTNVFVNPSSHRSFMQSGSGLTNDAGP